MEIKKYESQAEQLVATAEAVVIENQASMTEATELLSKVNKTLDSVKEEREKVTKPLNDALKAERARWKPVEDVLKPIVAGLREKMSEYQTALIKKQREEEAKIAARMKPGKGNLKADTAIRKMGEVDAPDTKVESDAGSVGFREKKVLKITDMKKIPKKFWIVDEDAVFEALKAGDAVAGAEIDIEMVPVNKR